MKSQYVLQEDHKTHCPKCKRWVWLLCRRDGHIKRSNWFYICFSCGFVAELGKGEVCVET